MHLIQKKKNLVQENRKNLKFTPEILVKLEKCRGMEETKKTLSGAFIKAKP